MRHPDDGLPWLFHDGLYYAFGSQSVFRGFQGIRDRFPGDPWIHLCNGYLEVYSLMNE
jgi:hypothetical protein